MDDSHEKLRHNPEKGLSGGESKKHDKKSKSKQSSKEKSPNNNTEERPAAFFAPNKEDVDKKTKKDSPLPESDDPQPKNEAQQSTKEKAIDEVENEKENELSEVESQEVIAQLARSRQEDIADNLTRVEAESPDEASELAAAAYLSSVERRVGEGEDVTEELLDSALHEAVEDLDYDTESIDEVAETIDAVETVSAESDLDTADGSDTDKGTPVVPAPTPSTPASPPTPPATPTPQVSPPTPTTPTPSVPPTPPPGGGPPSYFPPVHGVPPLPPLSPPINHNFYANVAPTSTVTDTDVDNRYYRRRRSGQVLVAGILGYVIGRRGGRKRTEKRLQPQIEALEQQVTEIHDALIKREETIRTLARKHSEADNKNKKLQGDIKKQTKPEQDKTEKPQKQNDTTSAPTNRERITHFVEKQQERSTKAEKQKTTERMHQEGVISKMAETHIAGLGMFVERRKMDGTENTRKRFEVMSSDELLVQVKDVKVDGISVTKAYKDGRIDDATLLEVTKRYWRKGTGSHETIFRNNVRPDSRELQKHRDKLESAHNITQEQRERAASEYAKEVSENYYAQDPRTLKSDEEKRAYFQRYADENAQQTELGTLLKKAQSGRLIKRHTGWLTLLVLLTTAVVIWFIIIN